MNIQAMMKQAQKLQKDMMNEKDQIDNKIFEGTSSFVTVKVKGNKQIQEIKIASDNIDKEEIEMLEDILLIAINNAMSEIDRETNEKLGKYTNGMPGLF